MSQNVLPTPPRLLEPPRLLDIPEIPCHIFEPHSVYLVGWRDVFATASPSASLVNDKFIFCLTKREMQNFYYQGVLYK